MSKRVITIVKPQIAPIYEPQIKPAVVATNDDMQEVIPETKVKNIETTRMKFRNLVPPSLFQIYINEIPHGGSLQDDYIVKESNKYVPAHKTRDPVRIYTWLDSTLMEVFESVCKVANLQNWSSIAFSSLYVIGFEVRRIALTELIPGKINELPSKTLYDLKIEIGDTLEFAVHLAPPPESIIDEEEQHEHTQLDYQHHGQSQPQQQHLPVHQEQQQQPVESTHQPIMPTDNTKDQQMM